MAGRRRKTSPKRNESICLSKDQSNEVMKDLTNLKCWIVREDSLWSRKKDRRRKSWELQRQLPLNYCRLHLLDPNVKDFVSKLVFLQDEYEALPDEDVKEDGTKSDKHVLDRTLLAILNITEFCKRVYGFDSISPEDQKTLLKACVLEILLLRFARNYDPKTDSTHFGNDFSYTRTFLRFRGMGEFADCVFNFCRSMSILKVDNAEYVFMTALCIFYGGRLFLQETTKVMNLQTFYMKTLEIYVGFSRKPEENFMNRLLAKLNELHRIGDFTRQRWLLAEMYVEELPPRLQKLLDVKQ